MNGSGWGIIHRSRGSQRAAAKLKGGNVIRWRVNLLAVAGLAALVSPVPAGMFDLGAHYRF